MTASVEQPTDEQVLEHPTEGSKTASSSVGIHSVTSSSVESSYQAKGSNPVLVNSEFRRIIGAFGAGYLLGKSGELDLGIIAQIFV